MKDKKQFSIEQNEIMNSTEGRCKCGMFYYKLYEIPYNGKIIERCRKCKVNYMKKKGLSVEEFEKQLAELRKKK